MSRRRSQSGTEPLPAEWWDVNMAHSVHASTYGGRIFVSWRCVDEPLVSDLEVEINEYGAPQDAGEDVLGGM